MTSVENPKKWPVMAAVASGLFLATIDGSIVNISLPVIEKELNAPFALVQWVILGYLLVITTLMLAIGRLADMVGKKNLFLAGYIVFTLGSALCGLATTIQQLIGFRALQALGASSIMALATAIVTETFPSTERGKALGLTGSLVSIGLVAGPPIGGIILGNLSWHWIFLVNIPIGIIGSILVYRYIPAWKPHGGQHFDLAGGFTLFACLLCFLLGLTLGQQLGFNDPWVLLLLFSWACFLVVFILLERRAPEPMIDFSLFRNKLFSINLITGFMTFVCSAGIVLLMPFYLQNIMHLDPRKAGLLLTTVPIAMGTMAPLAGWLSDRFGTRPLAALGLIILTIGYFLVGTLTEETSVFGYLLRFLPVGIGMGIFQSPNNSAIMGESPREHLGVASGLLSLSRTVGQTTGIALVGTFWATRIVAMGWSGGDATSAPPSLQVTALNQTSLVIVVFLIFAVALSLWAVWKEKSPSKPVALES
jgi:EmrB/QacA subfamily drug resistance transporter